MRQGKRRNGMESTEGHDHRGSRQTYPEKGKEKRTCLDIPRHTKGCGKEAADENGRKVGGSEEAEWRDTEKN